MDAHSAGGFFRRLVKTEEFAVDDRVYPVYYYEGRTLRGQRRYSSEIILSEADHVILDDDSMVSLSEKLARFVPAFILSRLIARRPNAA
jgi:hypothetical protein